MNFLNIKWIHYLKIKDNKLILSFIFIFLIASSILGFLVPKYISWLYEAYSQDNFREVLKYGFFLFLGQYFVRVLFTVSMGKYVKDLIILLRVDLFENWIYSQDKIMSTNKTYLSQDKYTRGEFQSRLIADIESIRELVTLGSLGIILDFIFIVSCMISFFTLEKFYGVALIIAEGLICIILIWLSKYIGIYFRSVKKSYGELSRVLSSISQGFKQLFYARRGKYSTELALPQFNYFLRKQLFANIWDASYYSLAESLFPILLAFIVFLFPYSEITSVAIFASLVDLIQRSINPIKGIAGKISNIQRAMASVQRVNELEYDLEKYSFKDRLERREEVCDEFEIKVDQFLYPKTDERAQRFGLKNISIKALKGESIGIIGQSGSGKSTLLKLLSGEIFTDQVNFSFKCSNKELNYYGPKLQDLNKLRGLVSLISQDSYVFSDTLEYNITLEEESSLFEPFWEKIKKQIPYIKEWGIEPKSKINPQDISLGQKQLISALRYCFDPRPIVLFDEVSSGLDGQLEKALNDFVSYIQDDVIMIVVAHRVETLIKCKKILFLENGSQQGFAAHPSLLEQSPKYKEFFTILNSV